MGFRGGKPPHPKPTRPPPGTRMVGFVEQGGPVHIERQMLRPDDTPSWVTNHAAWRDAVAEVERDCGHGPVAAPVPTTSRHYGDWQDTLAKAVSAWRNAEPMEGGRTWIAKPPPPPPPPPLPRPPSVVTVPK